MDADNLTASQLVASRLASATVVFSNFFLLVTILAFGNLSFPISSPIVAERLFPQLAQSHARILEVLPVEKADAFVLTFANAAFLHLTLSCIALLTAQAIAKRQLVSAATFTMNAKTRPLRLARMLIADLVLLYLIFKVSFVSTSVLAYAPSKTIDLLYVWSFFLFSAVDMAIIFQGSKLFSFFRGLPRS